MAVEKLEKSSYHSEKIRRKLMDIQQIEALINKVNRSVLNLKLQPAN